MKTYLKQLLLMVFTAVSVASCIDGDLNEPDTARGNRYLNSLDAQAASIEATLSDVRSLQEALDGENPVLTSAVESLEEHTAFLKNCSDWAEGSLATLQHQKTLASAIGTVAAHNESLTVEAVLEDIEDGAVSWLGKNYKSYYPAVVAYARTAILVEDCSKTLKSQKVHIEGIASDIEAGLKEGVPEEEVAEVAASVDEAITSAGELLAFYEGLVSEIETVYQQAVATAVEDPGSFDSDELASLNKTASVDLKSGDLTLSDLVARVEACETRLTDIEGRVTTLEGKVDDLNGLLNMIQSVTFMSDYSAENAIAYYTLGSESRDDGKKLRNPQDAIDLRYVIRPASAAQALTVTDLWDDEVKVFGYYAQTITKSAPETFDFDITNVTADEAGNGIVTVTVSAASLDESFYFKETGAKLALSIATGKTDLTSKFVEIVPKDASGTVYVESIELSTKNIEIDNGETADIDAYITPGNATEGGVIWTTSNADILTVTDAGVIEGKAVGTAVVTATTEGVDEWGNALTATCTVKVNPSIKIFGSDSVEEGNTTTLTVQSPTFISPEYITWEIGTFTSKNADGTPNGFSTNQAFASVDDSGNVSGLKMYYNTSDAVKDYIPLMVKCTIEGAVPVVLYHEIRVIAVQPLGITINGLSDADNQTSTKIGTAIGLYGTMKPEGVSTEYFKLSYLGASDGYFAANNVGTTTVTVSIENGGTGKYSYFYPKGKSISRNITVVVEPYYVQTVTLPATFEMNLDQTATLPVTLTSDFEGKDPTYPDLIWTSSAPEIVSINETTGEMTSLKEGSVTITATTSHANAVPSGQAQKSASCVVTVKKPTAAIAIGDYYYSDGTWSTERDYSKTVIGIVFAKVNAAVSDVHMINDHPECYNGLVVSTVEYTTPMVESGASWGRTIYFDWMNNNGYTQAQDTEKYSGYGTTKGLMAINSANVSNDYGTVYFDLCEPLLQHRNSVEAPEISSGWYLPSYPEMKLLYDNFDAVNASIQSVGGTVMTKTYTFTDTVASTPKDYTKDNQYYCTYVNNGSNWTAFNMNTSTMVTTGRYINDYFSSTSMPAAEWPVRIILAF